MKLIFSNRRLVLLAGSLALAGTLLPGAFGQTITSTAADVGLTATVTETLTVAATPATLTFALVPSATATASGPVSIVTTWVLGSANTSVELDGYFASATAALTDGAATPFLIPSSDVLGQVVTGTPTTFTAFTGTGVVGTAGAGLILFTQAITDANRAATRTDALNLEIDLTATPQLPAGQYTGTLVLQANSI
jgi:hypothetical protein